MLLAHVVLAFDLLMNAFLVKLALSIPQCDPTCTHICLRSQSQRVQDM